MGRALYDDGKWICAKKGNIGNWSAIGWLLGRRIRAEGIPYVGIVVCTQGASNIQAWIDEEKIVGTELDLPYEILHIDAKKEEYYWNRPGYLYHRLFEPYCPYTFGNAVWYQGESNAGEEYVHYLDLLTCMISLWRERDLDPDLPFTLVQIADFNGWWVTPAYWAGIQQAQTEAENRIPNLHTVRCADLSDIDQIHPVNKAPLADRLFASMRKYGTI